MVFLCFSFSSNSSNKTERFINFKVLIKLIKSTKGVKMTYDAVKFYEEMNRIEREKWNHVGAQIKKVVGGVYNYGVKPIFNGGVKPAGRFLGPKGIAGAGLGLLVAGPVGAVVGGVVGKYTNFSKIGNGIKQTSDFFSDARLYEEIVGEDANLNSSRDNEREETLNVEQPEYQDGIRAYLKAFAGAVKQGASYTAKVANSGVDYATRKVDNARKYRGLEEVASEISQKSGKRVTPKQAYQIMLKNEEGLKRQYAIQTIMRDIAI
jgi:uncharacterized protein YnzC (UPF0291/DUF896 family)